MAVLKAVILLRLCFHNEALFCHEVPIPKQQKREMKSIVVRECGQFYVMFQSHLYCIRQKADASSIHDVNIAKVCEKVFQTTFLMKNQFS